MRKKLEIIGIIICTILLLHDAYQLIAGGTFTFFGLATSLITYVILDELYQDLERQKKRKTHSRIFSN